MSDISNEAAGYYANNNDPTICIECGTKLSKEELETGRDVCFNCYCMLQD